VDEDEKIRRRRIVGISTSMAVVAFYDCEGEEKGEEDEEGEEEEGEEARKQEEEGERKQEGEEALSCTVHPTTSEPKDTQQR
jgi:hypothetical protein